MLQPPRNDTCRDLSRGLHQLFETAVDRSPEAVALIDSTLEITYAELERRANQVARHLRSLGVGPEKLVGICTARNADMVVAMLGALKAGGAYLALDPAYPRERLAFMLEDAAAPVVLTQERLLDRFPANGGPVAVCLDRDAAVLGSESPQRLSPAAGPRSLAYAIYTSGSTGRPKGVAIEHRSAAVLCHWARETFPAEDLAGMLASTSINFDLSVFEIFVPLAWGGTVILAENALALPQLPAASKIRFVNTVPSAMAELVRANGLPPSVRTVGLAGEPLKRSLVERIYATGTVQSVYNLYGPSEDTTYSTWARVERGAPDEPTIGRPVDGTELHLLDPGTSIMVPVPSGEPGEVYLGGAGLARGYLGRPELTAERFLPDPWSGRPGDRLYRVGDLGRLLPDGDVQFLGRVDHQVKIRGFRIELGEIEAALSRHPAVDEAVVAALAAPGDDADRRLVAYVALDRTGPSDLSSWLRERLPGYMVPSRFMILDALPRTPNGKVDRKALPEPDWSAGTGEAFLAPRTPAEERLAGIWAEVLGLERVGINDRFLALGGHSLLATRIVSRIREAFGVEIPMRRLFEVPTVAELARAVGAARDLEEPPSPLVPVLHRQELPLSFAQQRLWFLDQLDPGNPAYNIPWAVRLTGELSPALLARVLTEIVRRHETLRTTFVVPEGRDGRPVQVISPPAAVELPVIDLSDRTDRTDRSDLQAREIALAEALRPFDLERGPLLRLSLVQVGELDHLLLVNMHHIVSDGWSMGVLLREIAVLYEAFSQGQASPLPELPVQYADFAVWQRAWLQGDALEGQLAFWKARLAGAPAVLELPTDRPRPPMQTYRGAARPVALSPSLSQEIRELCRRQEATPFMALLAAWSVLLGRHASQDDVLVGSPIAGRNRREIEDLIGFFVNTLVLRSDLSENPIFSALLRQVRTAALDAYAHQDIPFERIVEELVAERDPSYSPLFQVLFVLQNAPAGTFRLPGLVLAPFEVESRVAQFDLSLSLSETPDGFAGRLEHNTDLFDGSTAERFLARFETLLAAVVADPGRPVADLPLVTPAERQQLLAWNETGTAPGTNLCLHELFAAQAERTPQAVALISTAGRMTYAELAGRAGALARRLRELGIGPDGGETRVAVCLERSPDLIAALLGVLSAGASYVPIDPAYPEERRTFMLGDSRAAVLVTRGRLAAAQGAPQGLRVLDLDAEEIPAAELPRDAQTTPGHLAYVIYTSGSTGRPKGVAIEHRSAAALVGWAREELSDEELSGVLAATSVCFDLSIFEIFVPLALGGTVLLAENALALPALPFASEVRLLNTVPSAATELVHMGGLPAAVQTVCLAGEPLPASLAERLYATGTVRRVLNLYGPSEDTTYSTGALIPRSLEGKAPAIGRPLRGTRAHVVDRHGRPVPPGVAGELWLAGAGLARGYLGRPELTAERFTPDPSGGAGERVYRTGDLVRLRPHREAGVELEFLGRIDHQVKVRGFRIELGEIEAVLGSHPAVQESVVVAREGALIAYLVLDPTDRSDRSDPSDLSTWLRERLPAYMVPSVLMALEALPRTPNGKVDRKALPAPDRILVPGEGFVPPRDEVELRLARIWEELLDVRPIGVRDNFFALGGHSLLATRVATRLRGAFGVELPLRMMFKAPTIAGLAVAVREAGAVEPAPPIVPVPRDVPGGELPLSFAQQRLWLIDQLDPGSPAYNLPWVLRLTGELAPALLARAFTEVVRRHEALRTTFVSREGRPLQLISPPAAVELPVVDLSSLAEAEREARALVRDEVRRPFDLERGPLLRLGLVRLGTLDHVLLVNMHHIVSDGWSIGVLLREIGALYETFSQGRRSPLPDLPVQYADFAVWQRSWLDDRVLEPQIAYWRQQLAGAPQVIELPTDRPRPALQAYRGSSRSLALPPALSDAVRDLCRQEEVTPFMALLTAWAVLLGRHAGQDEVLVGSPIAGRNRQEIEDLIGFFVNTLVLRVRLDRGSFRDLLAHVRSTALEAFAHQDLPFERLVEELAPERDLTRSPLFQILFVMQNAPVPSLEIPGLAAAPFSQGSEIAKFDLVLSLWRELEGFAGELEHNTDLFDGSTAERLLARFEILLEAAAAEPGRAIADLPLLLPQERQQILREWSDLPPAAPREASFPERFEATARAFPEEPAVISAEGEVWSYRRLDEASNRLARRLLTLGVKVDEAVGICIERSPELILGVVAVLKAGGVYVPLNPAHPDERLAFQVEDTGARVVLVHAGTRERLPELRRLEVDPAAGETADASLIHVRVPPESLCYVIYTSGSTGIPKGVGIPHGTAMLHSGIIAEDDKLGPGERVVQFSSLSFDVSIEQMLPTLISGAAVVLRGEDLANPAEMLPGFARLGITSANLPTAYWHQAVQGWSAGESPGPLRLRVQCVGGEAMLPEAARRWMALAGPLGLRGVRLINGYGPTETVVTATRYTVPESIPEGASSVPIGRLLPFRSGIVIDPRGDLQPVGVPGELCLGGILARGYVNRPDLTAEKLVPDPFSEEPGARMYRTGDLVRFLPDGQLDYFGRIDRQVKIRGFRIEPGEIEAVLASHPAVRECAVLVREGALVAYVALDRTDPTDPTDRSDPGSLLSAWLRTKLPDYMVPGATVFLDALPLTPNGKVDRKALPAPERTAPAGGDGAASADPIEEILAGIWAAILGLDRVGVDESFFALGGHSLLAAQVVSRIRAVLGVELPLRKLFERSTVAALARVVKAARQESGAPAPRIVPRPPGSNPPLAVAQQRIWFLQRLDPGAALFNIPALYTLSGPLELPILEKALAEIVRRHEALRTTIAGPDGSPFQLVHPGCDPDLPVVDLSALPAGLREREAERAAGSAARLPFRSDRAGSLTRFLLLRSAADDHRFLTVFHHLVSDGVSQAIFERELLALYEAFSAGRTSPLTDPPVQYGDYAAWQRQDLAGGHLAAQLAFWRERLAGPLPVLRLPTDRPRPEVPSARGASRAVTLPAELTTAVRKLSRREGSTLYITLLTAFLTLLYRATGQRDLPLGTPVSFRDRPEIEHLIGMFVNTLVLRAGMAPGAGFRAQLAHVRERVLEAFGHQEVPFERLVEELQPERGPHDTPFFQLMFALFERPEAARRAGGLELRPLDLDNGIAQFELTLYMVDTGRDLMAEMSYRTELFEPATIDRMLAAFQTLLAAAVAAPDLPIDELPFQEWLAAAPPPTVPAEPPPSLLGTMDAVAARAAQLEEKRAQLTDEQRERLRQKLRRK